MEINYPEKLFKYLIASCRRREIAWVVGSNNNLSFNLLSDNFKKIYLTFSKINEIKRANIHSNIFFYKAKEKFPKLKNKSVDIVCINNTLFKLDKIIFYKEVIRVLKKYGILAYWVFNYPQITVLVRGTIGI